MVRGILIKILEPRVLSEVSWQISEPLTEAFFGWEDEETGEEFDFTLVEKISELSMKSFDNDKDRLIVNFGDGFEHEVNNIGEPITLWHMLKLAEQYYNITLTLNEAIDYYNTAMQLNDDTDYQHTYLSSQSPDQKFVKLGLSPNQYIKRHQLFGKYLFEGFTKWIDGNIEIWKVNLGS